jgi:lambda family phage tail tape measure protein
MAMNMDALLRIKADVQGENNIRRLGNSLQGLQGQAKNAALGFNNLKGAVAGFGAAIAGSAIVAGLGAVIKKSIDAGDELFNLQAKTGVAASALIGIGNAAKLADVDVGTLGKGITKLNVNLVKAAEGNEDLARKFQALGVDVKDANGQVVPADKALKQIADRFADMPDGAQKAAAAVALFGKAGADLIPLLNEGAASMEKFTYKVGEDFAARSDKFNDTITELGIKTQGFGLELTDALLPALQSILEVFSDLFNSKQDFTELFAVIKFGIRIVASAIFVTIKLVDVLIKNTVTAFEAISKALKGDFAGAADIFKNRIGNFVEQAKQDFGQLGKIFTDAPSPGTGRRPGGRPLAVDTSTADKAAAAASKKRASEQERILEKRAALTEKSISLEEQLRRSVEDTRDAFDVVGASPTQKLYFERDTALTENKRNLDDFKKSIKSIGDEAMALGAKFDLKLFDGLIEQLERANTELTDQKYLQGLKDFLPSVDEYNAKIAEVSRGKTELTELEKLNAQVNLLQLDILAATNPALAEHVRLLRERATALDSANKDKSGKSFKDKIEDYAKSMDDLGAVLGDTAVNAFGKLEDSLTEFVTTGKLQFQEFVASIISDLAKLAVKFAVVNTVKAILGFEDGGIMTRSGPAPLKKYASGGIANSPQLAMFGEGSMPEAYVPLPDGRRIPVAMQGGGGGSTTVNVSVDAKGTSVQGNSGQGEQLGRAISQAVQAELIKQRRPGGILAMA